MLNNVKIKYNYNFKYHFCSLSYEVYVSVYYPYGDKKCTIKSYLKNTNDIRFITVDFLDSSISTFFWLMCLYCFKRKAWTLHKKECPSLRKVSPKVPTESVLLFHRLIVLYKVCTNLIENIVFRMNL